MSVPSIRFGIVGRSSSDWSAASTDRGAGRATTWSTVACARRSARPASDGVAARRPEPDLDPPHAEQLVDGRVDASRSRPGDVDPVGQLETAAVVLREELPEDLARFGDVVRGDRHQVGFGPPYLAVLHVHHSDGDPQRGRLVRVGERDHVRPARARPDDRLALRERTQPGQGIAQQGGALELLFCCRTSHLLLDRRSDGRDLAAGGRRPPGRHPCGTRPRRSPRCKGRCTRRDGRYRHAALGEANAASESEQVAQQPLHAPRLPGARVRPEQEQTGAATRPADEEDARETPRPG